MKPKTGSSRSAAAPCRGPIHGRPMTGIFSLCRPTSSRVAISIPSPCKFTKMGTSSRPQPVAGSGPLRRQRGPWIRRPRVARLDQSFSQQHGRLVPPSLMRAVRSRPARKAWGCVTERPESSEVDLSSGEIAGVGWGWVWPWRWRGSAMAVATWSREGAISRRAPAPSVLHAS